MAAAVLFGGPFLEITDANGDPVPGALVSIYEAGTSTSAAVYHDSDLQDEWTQPIECDSSGRSDGPVFVSPSTSLKIAVTDADGVPLGSPWPVDNWTPYVLES